MKPSRYEHPDNPDALTDEGIALDVALALGDVEYAAALERLARWANRNGYPEVTREQHEAIERGSC